MLFYKHALLKIKERKIEKELIKKVIQEPDFLFYDIVGKCMIDDSHRQGDYGRNGNQLNSPI